MLAIQKSALCCSKRRKSYSPQRPPMKGHLPIKIKCRDLSKGAFRQITVLSFSERHIICGAQYVATEQKWNRRVWVLHPFFSEQWRHHFTFVPSQHISGFSENDSTVTSLFNASFYGVHTFFLWVPALINLESISRSIKIFFITDASSQSISCFWNLILNLVIHAGSVTTRQVSPSYKWIN